MHSQSANKQETIVFVRWFVIFICVWQSLFNIPDRAIELVLQFVGTFIRTVGSVSASPLIIAIAALFPTSMYLLRKYVKSEQREFIPYVVCPSCFSLYKRSECFERDESGGMVPKRCSFIKFKHHPHYSRRLPCNAHLFKKVHVSGGKVVYLPKYVYAYQPLKQSFGRLLQRPGFTEKLEHWRTRESREGEMSDIYDGQV